MVDGVTRPVDVPGRRSYATGRRSHDTGRHTLDDGRQFCYDGVADCYDKTFVELHYCFEKVTPWTVEVALEESGQFPKKVVNSWESGQYLQSASLQ